MVQELVDRHTDCFSAEEIKAVICCVVDGQQVDFIELPDGFRLEILKVLAVGQAEGTLP